MVGIQIWDESRYTHSDFNYDCFCYVGNTRTLFLNDMMSCTRFYFIRGFRSRRRQVNLGAIRG